MEDWNQSWFLTKSCTFPSLLTCVQRTVVHRPILLVWAMWKTPLKGVLLALATLLHPSAVLGACFPWTGMPYQGTPSLLPLPLNTTVSASLGCLSCPETRPMNWRLQGSKLPCSMGSNSALFCLLLSGNHFSEMRSGDQCEQQNPWSSVRTASVSG